ncbi:hypothetical protein JB92DRAFT_2999951 [Gautieria morchelliformis]|nr:hypothetical protein JB92DRAFT_2999951 [Gautieria morchelliformis]
MPVANASLSLLSPTSSLLISGLIAGSYVASLYVARSSRLSFVKSSHQYHGERARRATERWRDDDDVIRARLKAALLSTCASCGVVYACVALGYDGSDRWIRALKTSFRLLGLDSRSHGYKSIFPNLLIPLLYSGPLTAQFLSSTLPFQSCWSYKENLRPIFTTWIGLRNFIVAPITEEVVFRACLLAVADLSGTSLYHKLFITPLWFGVAHLHHAYELYNKFGCTRSALKRAIMTCLVQMVYTTLFGAYASFLLLRSGSITPAITAHMTANVMGLPHPGWELRQHPKHNKLIFVAYFIGIVGFISASGPWTA